TGVEARAKVTETIAVVPFLEAASVTTSSYPDPTGGEDGLFFGAGLGVRYHTDFGPIRADLAIPLNRRAGVDDWFQFYVSIGQAF
ncbi:MAG: BamA/TamA family outer membrane protein, partial [Rhodospirillaceae bacterium]